MRRAHRLKGWWVFCFIYILNLLDDPMNPITQPTQIAERSMGSLLMDKNEKQWYFSCALQRQNRYLNMKEVLFNKLQRLKEETKYLGDNKPKFLRTLKSSIETKKIVERSVYLCTEIALGRQSAPDAQPCGRR